VLCAGLRGKKRSIFFARKLSSLFIEVHDLSPPCVTTSQTTLIRLAGLPTKVLSIIAKPITWRRRVLIQFNQFSLDEFKRQNLVYLKGIVSISIRVSLENLFQRIGTKIGPTARFRVKEHLFQAS
jgi:hypothetical protein